MLNWVAAALILVSLSGCAKKARIQKRSEPILLSAQQVRLVDVPVPLGARLEPSLVSDVSMGYHWTAAPAEAVSYYQVEMVQFGWRLEGQFTGPEELLVFEKPHRSVAISIRPEQQTAVQVLILVKYKK